MISEMVRAPRGESGSDCWFSAGFAGLEYMMTKGQHHGTVDIMYSNSYPDSYPAKGFACSLKAAGRRPRTRLTHPNSRTIDSVGSDIRL